MRQSQSWHDHVRDYVMSILPVSLLPLYGSSLGLTKLQGCPLLTNLSVFELAANLTKLRRLGLVKVGSTPHFSPVDLISKYR